MSWRNLKLLLWLLMWMNNTVQNIKVIGGKQTAVQGQDVSFSCTLTDKPASEEIAQVFWKKTTRNNTKVHDFFTVSPEYGPELVDDHDSRFKFIGSLRENNGSIHLSNVTLLDEGVYTCIFTLFPSGWYRTEIPLTVLVPPVTSLNVVVPAPVEREDLVTYASCIASGAKPPADVTWDTGSSQDLRVATNATQHANGTTTTVSHLVGVPTRNINHLLVQCVVKQQALATEETLPFTIEVHYIKVIGGKQTAVQGQDVSFSCTLTDKPASEEIAQVFWKKTTRNNTKVHDFFTVSPEYGPELVDDHDSRFKFIGSLKENDGSIHLSNVTLLDEGVYTCIFTLFPSGSYRTEIPLTVLVPPVTTLNVVVPAPVEREDLVTYASCIASGAKPPADVTWDTGSSQDLRVAANSTQHANGTTTTVSHLVGVPTRNINHLLVQCVVKQQALATEETLPFTIEVHYAPLSVNIHEAAKDVVECMSDSSPKATYTWSRVNQSWPGSGISAEGGSLQLISLTSDLGGLYACEASNPYGQQHVYLYVSHATGGCVTCMTLFILSFIAVTVAVVLAFLYYKHRFGKFPWSEEVAFQMPHHQSKTTKDLDDESHRQEEEEERET